MDLDAATTFYIPVNIPNSQLAEFVSQLTGNDDDIVLAAEKAMRDMLTPASYFDGEVECEAPIVLERWPITASPLAARLDAAAQPVVR